VRWHRAVKRLQRWLALSYHTRAAIRRVRAGYHRAPP
jgi:hypothetical protein